MERTDRHSVRSADSLVQRADVPQFTETHRARLTVMDGGEHRFYLPEQIRFPDA